MLKLLLLFIPIYLFSSTEKKISTGELRVTIRGIQVDDGGEIWVGLFDKASKSARIGKEYAAKQVEVRHNDLITVVFDNLPEGKYAINLFHDKNRNGQLDKSFFGTPYEGRGFSEKVFSVNASECQTLEIEVKY